MPPKQKKQKLDGQQTIGYGPSGLQLEKPPTDAGESSSSSASVLSAVIAVASSLGDRLLSQNTLRSIRG